MNREEAIKALENMKKGLYPWNPNEMVDMAIHALQQEPCEDAISREAAIDAMATWDWQELYLPIHFKQLLEELPSVSTEKTKSEWQQDHEILKAYSDGANDMLDKIKAEIVELRSKQNVGVLECLDIIDKYKAESEDKE